MICDPPCLLHIETDWLMCRCSFMVVIPAILVVILPEMEYLRCWIGLHRGNVTQVE